MSLPKFVSRLFSPLRSAQGGEIARDQLFDFLTEQYPPHTAPEVYGDVLNVLNEKWNKIETFSSSQIQEIVKAVQAARALILETLQGRKHLLLLKSQAIKDEAIRILPPHIVEELEELEALVAAA